MDRVT